MRTDEDYPYYQDPNADRDARERAEAEARRRAEAEAESERDTEAEPDAEAESEAAPEGDSPPAESAPPLPAAGVALGGGSATPRQAEDDEPFDELGPDEHDAHLLEDDATEDEIPCPACGELTYDDAPQCTHCGHWITEADTRRSSAASSIFTAAVVVVIILGMLLWLAS